MSFAFTTDLFSGFTSTVTGNELDTCIIIKRIVQFLCTISALMTIDIIMTKIIQKASGFLVCFPDKTCQF